MDHYKIFKWLLIRLFNNTDNIANIANMAGIADAADMAEMGNMAKGRHPKKNQFFFRKKS